MTALAIWRKDYTEGLHVDFLDHLTPALICQLFFILSAAAVLAVAFTPPSTRQLLIQYGARSSSSARNSHEAQRDHDDVGAKQDKFTRLISCVTSVGNVPHSWFMHFYVLSISSSVFWAFQFMCRGSILNGIAKSQTAVSSAAATMSINQVFLTWLMMLMQGGRRLYEHLAIIRPSSSKMWVVHWLLGCAYYLCIGVSIWVEGSRSILYYNRRFSHVEAPSLNELVGLVLFLFGWSMQYRCHKYLSSLRKYSFPEEGMFRFLICPHYTCECLLYLSIAITAAPKDQWYNQTLMCGLLFVSVNLGVTARGTKTWYVEKFGTEKVEGRWLMIPLVY
ncbi:uncharacterized protein BCR38DRAFT_458555 [Pseudomassariella vexata]|uniref:Polyprenal reductase n=1 Tax=Pseudomassariella vexata TaxID=1141098 RepID=A0A1Y2DXR6_9PEZI|nr:uncharacterized protein BCR38DRAFT_458555 [Pseudomassariella vexata]ORY63415.1 hypothetical protein BCR38DRAFT_458555 [Pseudomassariella vexata]